MDWDLVNQQLKICLDLYGDKIEAIAYQKILGVRLISIKISPSPTTGVSIVSTEFQPLRIGFLSSVFGIGDIELSQEANILNPK